MKVIVRLRTAVLSAAALGSVLLTACSSGQPTTATVPSTASAAATTPVATTPAATTPAATATAPSADQQRQALAQAYAKYVEPKPPANTPAVSGALGARPTIAKPVGAEPKKMVVKDIALGTGKEAPINAQVTVDYLGVTWADGKTFDTSFGKGAPASFSLSGLIPGWQVGIPGMKEGGRRELVIPAGELAYGPAGGSNPLAGKTLVFVIDLKKVA